jgi:hypothetical protein
MRLEPEPLIHDHLPPTTCCELCRLFTGIITHHAKMFLSKSRRRIIVIATTSDRHGDRANWQCLLLASSF